MTRAAAALEFSSGSPMTLAMVSITMRSGLDWGEESRELVGGVFPGEVEVLEGVPVDVRVLEVGSRGNSATDAELVEAIDGAMAASFAVEDDDGAAAGGGGVAEEFGAEDDGHGHVQGEPGFAGSPFADEGGALTGRQNTRDQPWAWLDGVGAVLGEAEVGSVRYDGVRLVGG